MPTYQCPTCEKVIKVEHREDAPHRPFCSQRCKLIDLYKWFAGEYKISDPLEAIPDAQADSEEPGHRVAHEGDRRYDP